MGPGIDLTPEHVRADRRILFALAPCFGLTMIIGLLSEGVYHDDDLTHFLLARWARWFPSYLLHIWGRPGLTLPLASVSWADDIEVAWRAARILSAMVTAVTALLAARLALRMGLARPHWAVVMCYAQPLVAVLAATTLTENFAAFYLIIALYMLNAGRTMTASAIFSLVFVSRHEAIILWPIWLLALAWRRDGWKKTTLAAACSIWAPIAHNVLFHFAFQRWPIAIFARPHGSTEYPAGGAFAYVPDALYAVTPMVMALAIIGGIVLLRQRQWLIPAMAGAFLLTHVLVKAIGVFASGGYGRFMVTVFPLMAILALAGLNRILRMIELRTMYPPDTADDSEGEAARPAKQPATLEAVADRPGIGAWIGFGAVWLAGWTAIEIESGRGRFDLDLKTLWSIRAAAMALVLMTLWLMPRNRSAWSLRAGLGVLALTCLAQWCVVVGPLRERSDQRCIREVSAWLEKSEWAGAPVFTTNPWFAYYLDLIEHPRAHKGPALLASMPVGTILLWDSKYSESDFHRLKRSALMDSPHYETLRIVRSQGPESLEVWVFQKIVETPPLEEAERPYPPDLAAEVNPVRGIYYLRDRRGDAPASP